MDDVLDENIIFNIAIQLDVPGLLNWCISNKRIDRLLCEKDHIWKYKLNKDFPYWEELETKKGPKDLYLILSKIEKMAKKKVYMREYKNIPIFYNESHLIILKNGHVPKNIQFLENLRRVDIFGASSQDLERVTKLNNLVILNILKGETIIEIPRTIKNMQNLEYLTIKHTKIKELPKEIGELHKLKELVLEDAKLENLPIEIGVLLSLQKIKITDNKLRSLPKEITFLYNLKELSLHRNNLKSLPEEIGDLKNLKILILSNNNLRTLPESIGNLDNLKILSVERNNLIGYPKSMNKLTEHLEKFYG